MYVFSGVKGEGVDATYTTLTAYCFIPWEVVKIYLLQVYAGKM